MRRLISCCPVLFLFLVSASFVFSSCKKSNDKRSPVIFTWTHGGNTYNPSFSSAFLGTGYTFTPFHIVAGFGTYPSGFVPRVDFHLTSFNTGTYTIAPSPATVNTLRYIDDGGFILEGISGTINITVNANNLLSGNFSVTLTDPSSATSSLTGSFANITISP